MAAIIAGGGNRQNPNEAVFWIDTLDNAQLNFNAEVTQHPVGARRQSSRTDHRYRRNATINLQGFIGGFPINREAFSNNLIDSGVGTISNALPVGSYALSSNPRVQYAYDRFREMERNDELFTLIMEWERFDDCVIRSMTIPQDKFLSEVLQLNLVIEQLRPVRSDPITLITPEKQDNAASNLSQGNANKQEVQDDAPVARSWDRLSRLLGLDEGSS